MTVRALSLCQNFFSESLNFVHAARLAALWFAVDCLLRGGRLSLTGLGRAGEGHADEKHLVKKIDRLLGNVHLQQELPGIYNRVAGKLLERYKTPVVIVDWTPWRDGFHALTAGIPVGGKCLTFYAEVHAEKKLSNPQVERNFLHMLKAILPAGTKPVVVTDGGFRTTWFDTVRELGWDYIGRIRGKVQFFNEVMEQWQPFEKLHERATRKPSNLGMLTLTKSQPREHRIVALHRPPKKKASRKQYHQTRGAAARKGHRGNMSTNDKAHRKSAHEPWMLATSLKCTAKSVVETYRARMQTEETYRGFKSHLFGWSFEDARSTTSERLAVLLMIGVLAALVVTIVGWHAETSGIHWRYQVNTTSKRRVLSWFYLGIRICRREEDVVLSLKQIVSGLHTLVERGSACSIMEVSK